LLLPIKPGGVDTSTQINPGSDAADRVLLHAFFDHVASEFTQTEVSPLFKAQQG